MSYNAPYEGGYAPGAQLFAVDGDFTSCDPCSLPVISYPFRGDSVLSTCDIVIFNLYTLQYQTVPLGTFPNIAPWSANQAAAVLEQEFMVALSGYLPARLNTPYDPAFALGSIYADSAWLGQFEDGARTFTLDQFILVEEGELQDMGGGICKIRRKWAILPPTRSETEQYAASFIEFDTTGSGGVIARSNPFTQNVLSRIQYDYFVFDDWNILANSPYDYFQLFTTNPYARRLNADTGLYPNGLLLPVQQYFNDSNIETANGIYIGQPTLQLNDNPTDTTSQTVPSASQYLGWCLGSNTSNGQTAEIVAESSTFTRWMGNIWQRRTRFIQAQ